MGCYLGRSHTGSALLPTDRIITEYQRLKDLTLFPAFMFPRGMRRGSGPMGWSARPPDRAPCREVTNRRAGDLQPFGSEQRALQFDVPAVPAEPPCRGDNTMTRNIALRAIPHDVTDRTRCSRTAGCFRDIAISRDPSNRDAADHRQDAYGKG